MISVNEITNGLTGAWRIVKREESARECFDLSADGALRSFAALALSLPIALFAAAVAWQIAQTRPEFEVVANVSTGAFIAAEIVSRLFYWVLFLLAMQRIARRRSLNAMSCSHTRRLVVYTVPVQ